MIENSATVEALAEKHGLLHPEGADLDDVKRFVVEYVSQRPTDAHIAAWADKAISKNAFNRPTAVMIATEAAKWVRQELTK